MSVTITPTATQGYQGDTTTNTLFIGNTSGSGTGYAVRYTLKPSKAIKKLTVKITKGTDFGISVNNVTIRAGLTTTNSATRPSSGTACEIGGTAGSVENGTLSVTFNCSIAANATVYLWLWTTSSQTAYFAIHPTAGTSQYADHYAVVAITGEEAAPSVYVKVGGNWKQCDAVYVKAGGSWKEATEVDARVGGVWKKADQ